MKFKLFEIHPDSTLPFTNTDVHMNRKQRPRSSGTEKPDLTVHFHVSATVWAFSADAKWYSSAAAYTVIVVSAPMRAAAAAAARGRLPVRRRWLCAA